MGLGTATVSDEQIRGTLRVGQLVQVKHTERKELVDATITKIQDCSQYTVGKVLELYKLFSTKHCMLNTYRIKFYLHWSIQLVTKLIKS